MIKIRVIFKKFGPAKYASHLDLLRAFIRTFRRSEFPLEFSQGFNPHAQIVFAIPLPVGVTSDCEIMDVSLTETVKLTDFTDTLSRTLPNGLEIVSADYVKDKIPKITRAEYILDIENKTEITQAVVDKIISATKLSEIMVEKITKRKTKQVNIIEHLHNFEIVDFTDNNIKIKLICSAGGEFNLKPELVINGISSIVPNLSPKNIEIHRNQLIKEQLS